VLPSRLRYDRAFGHRANSFHLATGRSLTTSDLPWPHETRAPSLTAGLVGAKISVAVRSSRPCSLKLESFMSAGIVSVVALSTIVLVAAVVSAGEPVGRHADVNGIKL